MKLNSRTSDGGCKLSDNPGQTGEGVSENLDFGHTSFMNAPKSIFFRKKRMANYLGFSNFLMIKGWGYVYNVGQCIRVNT